LVHLHVYFKIITGGSILKNHWIRVEKMFLENRFMDKKTNVYIPCAEADCILFVIRKLIEQPSPVENFLFHRDLKNILAELSWLISRLNRQKMFDMVQEWLPELDLKLFQKSLDSLENKTSILYKIKLGIRVRKSFKHTVQNPIVAEFIRSYQFVYAYIKGKLKIKRKNRYTLPGGLLIAFVGSEASGKSTLSKDVFNWLEERFDVVHFHLGKPKKNWRTKPIWLLIWVYSYLKKIIRFKSQQTQIVKESVALNLPNPIVSWLDSIDRKHAMKKYFYMLMQGAIVITDRYPSESMDGPRITGQSIFLKFLSRIEKSNYSNIPHPDIVIKAEAPLNITLARNNNRSKPEPEAFVRMRYQLAKEINFKFSEMVIIDTTDDYLITLAAVRNIIWNRLG